MALNDILGNVKKSSEKLDNIKPIKQIMSAMAIENKINITFDAMLVIDPSDIQFWFKFEDYILSRINWTIEFKVLFSLNRWLCFSLSTIQHDTAR